MPTNVSVIFGNQTQADTPEDTITYTFDPATGNLTDTYTGSTDMEFTYDELGQLTGVTVDKLNGNTLTGTAILVTTYTYDGVGNEISETLPNGVTTTYAYDDLNRLTAVLETTSTGTVLFSQTFTLNPDGTRASAVEYEMQTGGSVAANTYSWSYDAMSRLTGETFGSSISNSNYTNSFTYDLDSNRLSETHTGPGGGASETSTYVYNGNDELTTQTTTQYNTSGPVQTSQTTYTYDANGSETKDITAAANGTSTTYTTNSYTFDVRNRMVTYALNGTNQATYLYDDAGDRIQETSAGMTTFFLTNTNNPTGFDQPMEVKSSPTGTPTETYLIGNRVFAQANSSGTLTYLQADGHDSTRLLTNATGTVTGVINYDAFGNVISSSGSPSTIFMFAGDAVFDPASGLYFNGDGIRERRPGQSDFIEMDDQGYSDNSYGITANAEIYGDGDPVDNRDPSGHYSYYGIVGGVGGAFGDSGNSSWEGIANSAAYIFAGVGGLAGSEILAPVLGGIAAFNGFIGGLNNEGADGTNVNPLAAFAVGFAGSFTSSVLSDVGVPCWIASGVGGAITGVGNDYLENPNNFSFENALEGAASGAILGILQGGYCFVAGTLVLLGDHKTHAPIETVEVGQRVATDGGIVSWGALNRPVEGAA
jgi:YD repeat-containing protein